MKKSTLTKAKHARKCRICYKTISPFMTFGKMPIANGFLKKEDFEKEFRSKNGKWISHVDL